MLGNSRSVSDGGVLPQGGAEGGDLLGHLLHGHAPLRGSQRVVVQLEVVLVVQRVHLGLVRGERDVDLLQSLDPFGRQRVADLLEPVVGAGLSEIDVGELVGGPVLTGEVLEETLDCKKTGLEEASSRLRNRPEASDDPMR